MNFVTETAVINNRAVQAGDDLVVAEGSFQGTPEVFVRLEADVNLAEINELNGIIHPIQ